MAEVKNYKLGQEGVDVDTAPLLRSPNSLTKAQNAILDSLGVTGGLKKRPGLTKHNSIALAGSALGGISVPLASFVDTRTVYLAQQDGASVEGWYSSADLFATSGVAVTAIAAWQDPTDYFSGGAGLSRMGVFANGKLFYASSAYTVGTTSPIIRVYNGSEDREFSKIIPATTKGITGMFVSKGTVYILTLDSGTTDADFVGRVFSMDTTNGQLTQIGNAITTGHVPVSVAVYNSRIFVGTARVTVTNEAAVLSINPIDETTWTTDLAASADDYAITSLASFKGLLYGTTKNGGGATKGKILQRSLAGVWSTVDSTTNNSGTYDGSAVFGGALYVSARSYATTTTTAVVRKSTDGTTWTTATNSSATAGFGLMTVIGLRLFSMFGTKIQHTNDGAAWTSQTPGAGGNIDGALGILIASGAPSFSNPNTTPSGLGTNDSQTGVTTTTTTTSSSNLSYAQLQSLMGTSPVLSASLTLTDAQYLALQNNGAPQTIVAAQGTGKVIMPLGIHISARLAVAYSANIAIRAQYNGSVANHLNGTVSMPINGTLGQVYAMIPNGGEASTSGLISTQAGDNKALEISSATAGVTLGTTGGIYITVWYTVVSIAP